MKKYIKVQKYNTSENKCFWAWNFNLAERFCEQKSDSFNAVFAGEETIIENNCGFYLGNTELREITEGIFVKNDNSLDLICCENDREVKI